MRKELQAALDAAKNLPSEELPALAGDLELIRVTILARLAAPPQEREDKLIGIKQAAKRLGRSRDYLYRAKNLPFRRQNVDGGKLLFSSLGIDAYLKRAK